MRRARHHSCGAISGEDAPRELSRQLKQSHIDASPVRKIVPSATQRGSSGSALHAHWRHTLVFMCSTSSKLHSGLSPVQPPPAYTSTLHAGPHELVAQGLSQAASGGADVVVCNGVHMPHE